MLGVHIRERFFQRYGLDLTVEILLEIRTLAAKSLIREQDPNDQHKEIVTVHWRGADLRLVWVKPTRIIITFLPQRAMYRIAWQLPKKKKHVYGTTRNGRSRR